MKICFATNNQNKLKEIISAVQGINVVGLSTIGCFEELPENQTTIEGNSLEKATYVFEKYISEQNDQPILSSSPNPC